MVALIPRRASSARFVLEEYALSASTRSGRVRERPRPILGTRMLLSTAANCGLSPRCPAVTTRDISFWPCSQARCSLLVSPPRDRPKAWSAGSPTGGSACADGSCRARAACWWARVTVESTETSHVISPASSARDCSAVRIACQTPSSCQRRKASTRTTTARTVAARPATAPRPWYATGSRRSNAASRAPAGDTASCPAAAAARAPPTARRSGHGGRKPVSSPREVSVQVNVFLVDDSPTGRPHKYGCCDTPQRSDRDQRQPTPNPLLKRTLAPAADRTLRQRKPVPAEPTPGPGS